MQNVISESPPPPRNNRLTISSNKRYILPGDKRYQVTVFKNWVELLTSGLP